MKYYNPKKFDDLPEDPNEEEYLELQRRWGHDFGSKNCYDGTPGPRLTDSEKEHLRLYWKPRRDYDDLDVKLGFIKAEQLDALDSFIDQTPLIENATNIRFHWAWQTTSNANTQDGNRDRLRLGKLYTDTKTYDMWGFESWQEFSAHCHYLDKLAAKDMYDTIISSIRTRYTDEYNICCWAAKDDAKTYPGVWAVTLDWYLTSVRQVYIYANNDYTCKENIPFTKVNSVGLKRKTK